MVIMETRKDFSERFADKLEAEGWRGVFERVDFFEKDDFSPPIPYNPVRAIVEHDESRNTSSRGLIDGEYSASNRLRLILEGRDDDRWMTLAQAESLGYTIDPKTEGVKLEYWQFTEERSIFNDDGEPVLDADGNYLFEEVSLPCPKLSSFTVFNGEDVIGLEAYKTPQGGYSRENVAAFNDVLTSFGYELSESADEMFFGKKDDRFAYKLGEAPYVLGGDIVEKLGISDNAELCARLTGGLLEILLPMHDKYSYSQWDVGPQVDLIRKDHNAIYRAARDADKVVAWALNPELRQGIEKEFELKKVGSMQAMRQIRGSEFGSDYRPDVDIVEIKDRHYINVPFDEKDELKAVAEDAKFCAHIEHWWVHKDSDLSKVAKWESVVPVSGDLSKSPVVQEFTAECKKHGLIFGDNDPVADGFFHKVSIEGADILKTGAYRFTPSRRANGKIINSETGLKEDWVYTGPSVNPNELASLLLEAGKRKEQREQRFNAFTQNVAAEAKDIYANMTIPANLENCPYFVKENFLVGDVGYENEPRCNSDGALVLPIKNCHGKIESLVSIDNEKQTFLKGYRPEGGYHMVYGALITEGPDHPPSVIVKDFEQAVRIHHLSGSSVAVAFDHDNIAAVYSSVKDRYPSEPLVIAVDKAGDLERRLFEYNTEDVILENVPDLNAIFKENNPSKAWDIAGGYVQTTLEDFMAKQLRRIEGIKDVEKSRGQETGVGI